MNYLFYLASARFVKVFLFIKPIWRLFEFDFSVYNIQAKQFIDKFGQDR